MGYASIPNLSLHIILMTGDPNCWVISFRSQICRRIRTKTASLFNNLSKTKIQEYALEVDKESKAHHHFNLLLPRF